MIDDVQIMARGVVAEIKDGATNNRAQVSSSGALLVEQGSGTAATPTLTNVNASASSGTLAAANSSRRGLIIANDADKALMLKYGATASATSFTVKVAAGGYWEMPLPIYAGLVDGIWETGPTGAARVTELI